MLLVTQNTIKTVKLYILESSDAQKLLLFDNVILFSDIFNILRKIGKLEKIPTHLYDNRLKLTKNLKLFPLHL